MSRETIHTAQAFLRFTAMVTLCAAAFMAGAVHAQAPVPEAIPAVLPDPVKATLNTQRAGLDGQRMALAQKVAAHNARCRNVPPENTVLTADCAAAQQNLNSEIQAYRQAVASFNTALRAAINAQITELNRRIDLDITSIRRLGFDRRAQDFDEWVGLSEDAQREFENTVKGEVTTFLVDKAKGGILDAVKNLDKSKVNRWIGFLDKHEPRPVELIEILQRIAAVSDSNRAKLADDAKALVSLIERFSKTLKIKDWADAAPVMLEMVCDAFQGNVINAHCKGFRAVSKIAVASVYNNVSRQVAFSEIENLSRMTADQLRGLQRIQDVLTKHIKERKSLRESLAD